MFWPPSSRGGQLCYQHLELRYEGSLLSVANVNRDLMHCKPTTPRLTRTLCYSPEIKSFDDVLMKHSDVQHIRLQHQPQVQRPDRFYAELCVLLMCNYILASSDSLTVILLC